MDSEFECNRKFEGRAGKSLNSKVGYNEILRMTLLIFLNHSSFTEKLLRNKIIPARKVSGVLFCYTVLKICLDFTYIHSKTLKIWGGSKKLSKKKSR